MCANGIVLFISYSFLHDNVVDRIESNHSFRKKMIYKIKDKFDTYRTIRASRRWLSQRRHTKYFISKERTYYNIRMEFDEIP